MTLALESCGDGDSSSAAEKTTTTTIKCYADSDAEEYAKKNNLKNEIIS